MVAYYYFTIEMANRTLNTTNSANIQLFRVYIEEACGNRADDKCSRVIRRLKCWPSKAVQRPLCRIKQRSMRRMRRRKPHNVRRLRSDQCHILQLISQSQPCGIRGQVTPIRATTKK